MSFYGIVPSWFWEVLYIRDGDLSKGISYGYVLDDSRYLVILWLVGFFAFPGIGQLIDILLVIAVIIAAYRLLTGRHILSGEKR